MNHGSALALPVDHNITVRSDLLGELQVASDEVLEFPRGLFGLPECRRFVLVHTDRPGVYWLQSLEHGTLAFLLVDPFLFFEGYVVDLGEADRAELQVSEPADAAILAITTLPRSRDEQPTANLQGPLVLNLRGGTGKQLAVENPRFGVRCPFDLTRVARPEVED
jgi:flagellar assembly factor FliW